MRRSVVIINVSIKEFQSTHPLRDATGMEKDMETAIRISIHAPLTGCDNNAVCTYQGYIYFNPRTPYGMRQHQRYYNPIRLGYFNPRTPYGMRPWVSTSFVSSIQFQSTHPLRDATLIYCSFKTYGGTISIHAPLTGCDVICLLISSA